MINIVTRVEEIKANRLFVGDLAVIARNALTQTFGCDTNSSKKFAQESKAIRSLTTWLIFRVGH